MSKKAQIIYLKRHGVLTNKEIAERVGCRVEYVRSAWARRNGARDCDKAWVRRRTAALQACRKALPRDEWLRIWRAVYNEQRANGECCEIASSRAGGLSLAKAARMLPNVYYEALHRKAVDQ